MRSAMLLPFPVEGLLNGSPVRRSISSGVTDRSGAGEGRGDSELVGQDVDGVTDSGLTGGGEGRIDGRGR